MERDTRGNNPGHYRGRRNRTTGTTL
ncbi:hypothetical protein ALC62_13039 [Cyphomyrmex costatus]|uniref:Uncharacterized protein n=1 Tax=Cyphomyrmex costatus TaxID=456900 RepID=A0A195C6B4_9HYME|nr:hypothetical protein ALC62_13039 [Cyphomyrmex costatus]